jgi:hypothetical protein
MTAIIFIGLVFCLKVIDIELGLFVFFEKFNFDSFELHLIIIYSKIITNTLIILSFHWIKYLSSIKLNCLNLNQNQNTTDFPSILKFKFLYPHILLVIFTKFILIKCKITFIRSN